MKSMNERADGSEFLLGIEEYLRYHNHERMGKTIHALSRALGVEDNKEQTVKVFFQEFSGGIGLTNLELADLMHRVLKSNDFKMLRMSLLYYLAKKVLKKQNLIDLIFACLKAEDLSKIRFNVLKFLAKEIDDIDLKDLIFSTLKSSSNDENILRTSISFLSKTQDLDLNLPFDQLRKILEDLLDIEAEEDKKELASLVLKFSNLENVTKSLLQYVGKVKEEDANLSWLAFAIKKTDQIDVIYKIILQFIPKYESVGEVEEDLIHGFTKDDKIEMYKSLLLYLGKITVEEYASMSSLAIAIRRALMSEKFEEEVIKGYLSMLDSQFLGNKIFRGINNYIKNEYPREPLNDAFSRSQVKSKIWLISELFKIQEYFPNILIMAGWFGQLKAFYDDRMSYNKLRLLDINRDACIVSDYFFNLSNLEDYKVKSVCADINNLTLHKNGYELLLENFKEGTTVKEKFLPDLIINTSAEHMTEEWYNQIRFKGLESQPVIAIQSNNLFNVPEHINSVYSSQHLLKKYPMSEVLYEGELQLKGYKRIMIIGRP